MVQRKYGWIPQLPDIRDYKIQSRQRVFQAAPPQPPVLTLRNFVKEIYDQGETSSCTGNAIAQGVRITQAKEGLLDLPPSRSFIYYNERLVEGDVSVDGGADLRDGMKVVAQYGAGIESDWPFDLATMFQKPSAKAYKDAVQNMVKSYAAVNQDLYDLKQQIVDGYPIIFGFSVYQSFESQQVADTGIVPMPSTNERQLGGHAVCIIGYNDDTQTFEVVNSWSPNWGDKGFFHMPYNYVTNPDLASDFWTITMLETQHDAERKWRIPK